MRERSLVALGALLLLATPACPRAEGPAAVAWDRTRCERCSMLVSDPSFAAQLHAADGSVQHFDDPGCLLLARNELRDTNGRRDSKLWLHHHREERWLADHEAAFIEVSHTPMGYGFAVVAVGEEPGAVSFEEAQQRIRARHRGRESLREGMEP